MASIAKTAMDAPIRILIVEDLLADVEPVQRHIRRALPGSIFFRVESCEAYLAALEHFRPTRLSPVTICQASTAWAPSG